MIWSKTDIITYLSELRGYRTYLEICTPTTGNKFAKIDQSKFDVCHRLMYRCPENFEDGLKIDFRTPDLDTTQCIVRARRSSLHYDIILVDPWHEYGSSYRDIETALSLLSDKGSIVVHDCMPPTADIISPTWIPGAWCGVTFMAYIDFVTRNKQLEFRTVDTDYGCGIIQRSDAIQENRVPLSVLESWNSVSLDPRAAFQLMHDNKQDLLHLISVDSFIRTVADIAQMR